MDIQNKVIFDKKFNQFFTILNIATYKCENEALQVVKLACENPAFYIQQTQFSYDFLITEIKKGNINIVVGYERQFFSPFEKQKLLKFLTS